MRIGIDARMAYYSQAGIGHYIHRLINGLAKIETQIGAEDELILLQSRKDNTNLANDRFEHSRLWTPCHNRFEQWTFPIEIKLLGLDVLHSPDFIPPFYRSYKSVITIHDLAFLLYPHFLTPDSARYYGQIDVGVRRTDHIIAVSNSTKQDAIRLLGVPNNKITVIHEAVQSCFCPIEESDRIQAVRSRYNLPERFFLFVSTIEPRKNLPALFQALRLFIDRRGLLAPLVIVGRRGWLSEEVYATVSSLRLEQAVIFLDRVPTDDLILLYNAATCLLYPSLYEGFGLPPLEAMACGCPTIVSAVSSLPEVVGDAGLLLSPGDVEGWAGAMSQILEDADLRRSLREKGLKQAGNFNLEKMACETLAVYRKVARLH